MNVQNFKVINSKLPFQYNKSRLGILFVYEKTEYTSMVFMSDKRVVD